MSKKQQQQKKSIYIICIFFGTETSDWLPGSLCKLLGAGRGVVRLVLPSPTCLYQPARLHNADAHIPAGGTEKHMNSDARCVWLRLVMNRVILAVEPSFSLSLSLWCLSVVMAAEVFFLSVCCERTQARLLGVSDVG